jgi:hypothetical protein
MPEPKCP